MATPINAPMAGEIWHLSIEDLFQPVQDVPRLGGDGPFVINLSVSTAPISVPTKAFTNSRLEAHVYQIQVTEDGRTRFRLRLGPFTSEDEADAILAEVRDTYPGALTATAGAADLRAIGSIQAKVEQRKTVQSQADLSVEKAASQKIAAEKSAPEKALLEKAATVRAAPTQAAAAKATPAKATPAKAVAGKAAPANAVQESPVVAKPEANEISIDIAWPTPELVLPRSTPPRLAPTALPELDVPLPGIPKRSAAPVAPVLREPVEPAPKPVELQLAPPFSIAGVAPVLTEVVTPTKSPAPKIAAPAPKIAAPAPKIAAPAPKIAAPAPAAIAAPVLRETVQKNKEPAPSVPTVPAAAAAPVAVPPQQAIMAPAKPAVPNSAAPIEAAKPAPVLTQSLLAARKSKFRALLGKPMASKLTSLQHVVATAPAAPPREVKKLDEPLESLESTQTMRALTPTELEDDEASRWFVIQLALADHAFDPDAVPNLDIFSEYRLYSVAGLDGGRVVHTLRLGFFREEIGAVAVASYLAAYWDKPTIKRVSVAERERFADQRVEARKDVGATGKHAVIEITDELVARRRRSSKTPHSWKPSNRSI